MAGSRPAASQEIFQLPLMGIYAEINKARRKKTLMPVDPSIISVRVGVKFAIMRRRPLKIEDDTVFADETDIELLEKIIYQLFDVSLIGTLIKMHEVRPVQTKTDITSQASGEVNGGGMFSRIVGRLIGERGQDSHHDLNVNGIILAIVKRRAFMGFKPISPAEIRKRCENLLHNELQLDNGMGVDVLTLNNRQVEILSHVLRREFQIMFDDLVTLVEQATNVQAALPAGMGSRDK